MAGKRRCVIVHENGPVTLADGETCHSEERSPRDSTCYNLDKAIQEGANIAAIHPIGSGASVLLILTDVKE